MKYDYESIYDSVARRDRYRIRDVATDNAIAFSYDEANAKLVVRALNALGADYMGYMREVVGNEQRNVSVCPYGCGKVAFSSPGTLHDPWKHHDLECSAAKHDEISGRGADAVAREGLRDLNEREREERSERERRDADALDGRGGPSAGGKPGAFE